MQYDERKEYCLYLRKSRMDLDLETQGQGDTLKRHEDILLSLAARNRYKIGKIYKEVVSGETIAARPEMQQLLIDIENKRWKGVIVVEVERLARGDTIDQGIVSQAFKYSDTRIITPSRVYDPNDEFDEEYFEFGLFMSRREYKKINQRMNRGRISSVKEGKYVGNIAPFGYDKIRVEKGKGYTLIPNESAETIKMIYELYINEDLSINSVARRMNELGMKPMLKDTWSLSSIKDVLSNPVYAGKIRWNARKGVKEYKNGEVIERRPRNEGEDLIIVDGLHKPLIDPDVWQQVQEKRKRTCPKVTYDRTLKNPFAGLVFCEKCGSRMTRRPYASETDTSYICSKVGCENISTKFFIFEQQFLKYLKEWVGECEIKQSPKKKTKDYVSILEKSLIKVEQDLEKQKLKFDKVCDFFEEGVYTKEVFLERTDAIHNKITTLNSEIEKQKNALKDEKSKLGVTEKIIPKISKVIELFEADTTAEDKNKLLKQIIEKITYRKDERAIGNNADPTNFELNIYPKQEFTDFL